MDLSFKRFLASSLLSFAVLWALPASAANISLVPNGDLGAVSIGTGIALNSTQVLGHEVNAYVTEMAADFRNRAPTTSEQAATIILDGVREDRWRILVGDDAHIIDDMVRETPEEAYEDSFRDRMVAQNTMSGLVNRKRGQAQCGALATRGLGQGVERQRQGPGLAGNVGGEGDGGAKLAQTARESQQRADHDARRH